MNHDTGMALTNMVNRQVRCWDVDNPAVLAAISNIPRDRFLLAAFASLAYADTSIPLGPEPDQVMMHPKIEGRLLQALTLSETDQVLEIGTGSGFLTACLAQLAGHVSSIDISASLSETAQGNLNPLNIKNCELQVQDVFTRDSDLQFDAIAITGSLPEYDPRFEAWLRPHGRAFMVVGKPPVMQAIILRRNDSDDYSQETLFETTLPALRNAPRYAPFAF
jgi:protein-L-isoaspartate(D-aspartate) O-methyltransferase